MFVLDTNVLSAIMRADPPQRVAMWVSAQSADLLFTTAVSHAEILSGLAELPEGRRRSALEAAARAMFLEDFDGRVLPFDMSAAVAYADIFVMRRKIGRATPAIDLMIAAIARSRGARVVTRNVGDFDGCGVGIVDPWQRV
ncbi:MAG TPA: type II toxin-antitoxin system VapC family toxin [Acetobacteraceae bacterium]|jgi:hypothetical protein|nr:type II toxin-antitoxin system VapC family toxin [Acetobacteraceae bacterium]